MTNPLAIYEELSPLYKFTKAQSKSLVKSQIEYIIESGSSEQAFAFLKKIKELVDPVLEGIKETAINEVRKGNDFAHGVKMTVKGKTTYDYSRDPIWKKLKEKIKQREDYLKSLNFFQDVFDQETGEVTRVFQAGKKVSDYIECEF